MTVVKQMALGDIMYFNQNAKEILLDMGMTFVTFPLAQRESLESACEIYNLEVDDVLGRLNGAA